MPTLRMNRRMEQVTDEEFQHIFESLVGGVRVALTNATLTAAYDTAPGIGGFTGIDVRNRRGQFIGRIRAKTVAIEDERHHVIDVQFIAHRHNLIAAIHRLAHRWVLHREAEARDMRNWLA